jgi:hypothetical protein
MVIDEKDLKKIVLVRTLKLNAKIQGITAGVSAGLLIFFATNWLLIKGGDVVGPHLALLGQFFIGYKVSFVGSLIGFAYAFVTGFVVGYGVAKMYNWIADLRDDTGQGHAL